MKSGPLFYQLRISANSDREAHQLLEGLLKDHLIAGGSIARETSVYWWKNKLNEQPTFNITAYTRDELRASITRLVKTNHSDETPIIAFTEIDRANSDLLDWITKNTTARAVSA